MKNYKIFSLKKEKDIKEIMKDIYNYDMNDYIDIERKDLKRYSYDLIIFDDFISKLDFMKDYYKFNLDNNQIDFLSNDIRENDKILEFLSNEKYIYIYDNNLMIYKIYSIDDIDNIIYKDRIIKE